MFEQEVARGALELDAAVPGWDERIDLERLNLGDCAECVLGQVFGHFKVGLQDHMATEISLDEGYTWSARHGFYIDCDSTNAELDDWYDALRSAWVTLITARRESRLRDARRERAFDAAVAGFVLV